MDGNLIHDPTNFRSGAIAENPVPKERKVKLDVKMLNNLGINIQTMMEEDGSPDSLIFYQLMFLLCYTARNSIHEDPRLPFYSDVSHWTNLYAVR